MKNKYDLENSRKVNAVCLYNFNCDVFIIPTFLWTSYQISSHICRYLLRAVKGPGGSMSQVVGLPNNSCKPITNTAWVQARLCKLQKGCTRLAAVSDKVYQLLAHGQWFSPGTLASSTTKTGRPDIAEILLKVALKNKNQSIYVLSHMERLHLGKKMMSFFCESLFFVIFV